MGEYIAWDYSVPGISFNVVTGRITIFKTTLAATEYPEYFRFLFSPEDLVFGIEPCAIDDGGAQRLPDEITRAHYDIKSIDLVRFIYQSCGWKKKLTYRIAGEKYGRLVCFGLRRAYVKLGCEQCHNCQEICLNAKKRSSFSTASFW